MSSSRAATLWLVALICALAVAVGTVHLGPYFGPEWRGGILAAAVFICIASLAGVFALRAILARLSPDGDVDELDFGLALSVPIAIATIVFGIIAFGSATFYLLDGHVADIESSGYDVWRLELYYAWSLLEAVPLLNITGTLGWESPLTISGHLGGFLLLAFKAVEILPLLGALTAIAKLIQDRRLRSGHGRYQIESGWPGFSESLVDGFKWWHPPYFVYYIVFRTGTILLSFIPQLMRSGLVILAVFFLVNSSSPMYDALPWLDHGATRFTIAMVVVLICALQIYIRYSAPIALVYDGSIGQGVAIFLSRVTGLILACLAVISLTLVLVEFGAAFFSSPIDQDKQAAAVVEWYVWNVADAVPVLEVPKALDWPLGVALVDPWSRSLLLLVKIFVVSLVILPVQLLVRLYRDNIDEQMGDERELHSPSIRS